MFFSSSYAKEPTGNCTLNGKLAGGEGDHFVETAQEVDGKVKLKCVINPASNVGKITDQSNSEKKPVYLIGDDQPAARRLANMNVTWKKGSIQHRVYPH